MTIGRVELQHSRYRIKKAKNRLGHQRSILDATSHSKDGSFHDFARKLVGIMEGRTSQVHLVHRNLLAEVSR